MSLNVSFEIAPLFYIITDTSLHLICSLYILAVVLSISVIQLISFFLYRPHRLCPSSGAAAFRGV